MTQSEPSAKSSGRYRWLLISSLAVNLVVLGVIGGFLIRGPDMKPRSSDAMPLLYREMPAEFRKSLREEFKANREKMSVSRREIGELRTQLIDALEAENFDIANVEALMGRYSEITRNIQASAQSALLEAIRRMDPEDRAEYASNLRKPRKRKNR